MKEEGVGKMGGESVGGDVKGGGDGGKRGGEMGEGMEWGNWVEVIGVVR